MAKKLTPRIPFVQASKTGGKQRPSLIVLRNSMTPSTPGSAFAIAQYWHRTDATESCHYVIDEAKIYRCVDDKVVSLPNSYGPPGSLVINLCGEPENHRLDWEEAPHFAVIAHAADLVADLCIKYRIPPRYLTITDQHIWEQSWFPRRHGGIAIEVVGTWPRKEFLSDVIYQISQKKR